MGGNNSKYTKLSEFHLDLTIDNPNQNKCLLLFLAKDQNLIFHSLKSPNYVTIIIDQLHEQASICQNLKATIKYIQKRFLPNNPKDLILVTDHYSIPEMFNFVLESSFEGYLVIIDSSDSDYEGLNNIKILSRPDNNNSLISTLRSIVDCYLSNKGTTIKFK